MSDAPTPTRSHAGVIAPPPLLMLAAILAGLGLDYLVPLDWPVTTSRVLPWSGAGILFAIAIGVNLQGFLAFQRARTPVHPYKTPTNLVVNGVYNHVRNPMYLGMLLIIIAIGLAMENGWLFVTAGLFLAVLHFGVVRREERFLTEKFGDAYTEYKNRVPPYGWSFRGR